MKNFTTHIRILLLLLASFGEVKAASSVTANFNGTPIPAGKKIWYTAVVNVVGTATYPLTIYFTGQTISSPLFTRTVPDAILVLDPSVTTATTVFNGTAWVTTARPDEPSFYFLSGYRDSLTSAIPGGLDPVTWTGTFTASRPGISLKWHMAAAVYTSFNSNLNNLGVKPSGCSACSIYPNSHQSGTPENYLAYVTGGARGGGGSNYTGGYSGVGSVSPAAVSYYNTSLCVGSAITLSPISASGSWASSNTSIATVSGGVVTGVSAGTAKISYKITGSPAWQIINVTVNALPAITASATPSTMCASATLTLNATASSTGSSSGGGSSSGSSPTTFSWHGPGGFSSALQNPVRTGATTAMSGVYSVTLTNGVGCAATGTVAVTISTTPVAGTITGSSVVCAGSTIALSNTASGGTWSSSASGVASVNTAGIVTGITAGTTAISYEVTTSCGNATATKVITVNVAPNAGTITGGAATCPGSTMPLANTVTGGVWSSAMPGVATVSPTGVVTGVSSGATIISYTVSGGCGTATATKNITISASPDAGTITGSSAVCPGSTIALANTVSGGTWGCGATGIATISSAGIVTGVSSGATTISYTVSGSCGSATATKTITISTAPDAGTITGSSAVCAGSPMALANTVTGGVWSSGATSVATVSASGVVTGIASGTATISYTVTGSCGTSNATKVVSVNSLPDAGTITGSATVCQGAFAVLSNTVSGGVWSSAATGIATVNTAGVVSGVSFGATNISYTVTNSCGSANTTKAITVNSLPVAGTISGGGVVCAGSTTALSNTVTGGAWSSGASGIATVNTTGVVTGITSGTATISYNVANSCGTASATSVVSVNPMPDAGVIIGNPTVCSGSVITLGSCASGGVWSSSATAIGTISPAGVVAGISSGTATISYTVSNSCGSASATAAITVTPSANAGAITGTAAICAGATLALSNTASGGVWSSGASGVTTVSSTGVVTGISSGTATISYSVTNSCGAANAISVVTVNALPDAGIISGSASVCAGSTTTLGNCVSGGVWSSSAASVATVTPTGIITGNSSGTASISYTVANSCGSATATKTITVNAVPAGLSGPSDVNVGSNILLTVAGGTWSSNNTSVAIVDASGNITGVSTGTATISYSVSNSCYSFVTTKTINVNAITLPPTTGTLVMCNGNTTSLSNATGGGTWSSSNTAVATINAAGVVTGVGAGTATISYSLYSSVATVVVTINALPEAIAGGTNVCAGATMALSDITSGGSWSSSAPSVATIDPATGLVSGISNGSATIIYTLPAGCSTSTTINVASVNAITGTLVVCVGSATSLANATPGGTWSSSIPAIAAITTSGIVSGISAGASNITYTAASGCYATQAVTVNATPFAISGPALICAGASALYTNATIGGTWSTTSTNISLDGSGNVNGLSAGAATITYTNAVGCYVTKAITINAAPAAIAGPASFCISGTTALTNATSGGTWASSNPTVATIAGTGIVTGIAAGTTAITYALSSGCFATKTLTVLSGLPAITGNTPVCAGSTLPLFDSISGGTWTSSNTAIATVSSSGVVTGVAGGTARITYAIGGGCSANVVVTVNPILPITGNKATCIGNTTTLADATTGGTWGSNDPGIATVGLASGIVTGVTAGTTTITYTLASGCFRTVTVNISTMPPITGTMQVCVGLVTTLANAATGGTWSSSHTTVGTIGLTSGIATGINAGTTTITYTAGGCKATAILTVAASPAVITGPTSVCIGAGITLADATAGGIWSTTSPNVSISGVTTNTLTVTGVTPGVATISYSVGSSGCYRAVNITVNPLPSAITGTLTVCPGGTTTLANPTSGGTWSSSNTTMATLNSPTSGVVNGITTGVATITYKLGTGCIATTTVTIISSPLPISGPSNVCTGSTITLSDSSGSGTWSSGNVSFATVGTTTGIVVGVAAGTANISFTLSATGCKTKKTVTVTAIPNAGTLSGPTSVSVGATITLVSSGSPGGSWSSSNSNASVGTSGIVTGLAAGSSTITYSVSNACGFSGAYKPISIAAARSAQGSNKPTFGNIRTAVAAPSGQETKTTLNAPAAMVNTQPIDVRIIPNPNKGSFTIKGTVGTLDDETIEMEVTNMLGQVMYKNRVAVRKGIIDEQLQINNLANGPYILNIKSSGYYKALHFVVRH